MKKIKLNKGLHAIVDDADYKVLLSFTGLYRYKKGKPRKWFAKTDRHGVAYAVGNRRAEKDRWVPERMHRVILGIQDPSIKVDHINGNGLDNRRSNLRLATNQENLRNMRKSLYRNGTRVASRYKGVTWSIPAKKWRAYITVGGKQRHLGLFQKEKHAAIAYDAAAEKYFGKYARLNNVNQD